MSEIKITPETKTETATAYCERCLLRPAKLSVVVPLELGEGFGFTYCPMSLCGTCIDSALPDQQKN